MRIPVLCGPTAAGKTAAALALFGGTDTYCAIAADSMQVYRCMDIATAKPTPGEQAVLRHEMIDCVHPEEHYSAGQYLREARERISHHLDNGKRVVIVGGTGLYIKALLQGLFEGPPQDRALRDTFMKREKQEPGILYRELSVNDPPSAARIHQQDIRRIVRALEVLALTGKSISYLQSKMQASPWTLRLAGLTLDRAELAERIERRIDAMFAAGLLDEVRMLRERGCHEGMVSMQGLGYRECLQYLEGRISLDEAKAVFLARTKSFAQKQIMLFRRIPGLVWFYAHDIEGLSRYFHKDARS
ncbi:MAG: tRNA (adenosine(37)-N6)-dimethylallyltransferase MiaA [Spirochaetota bacterium]|jgi:tRNA dimethylallyltransferase|nr:tRNA (adenosine(37)-N6)-dimethylallyltransferase MiaA [Spirochaetota bacterium]